MLRGALSTQFLLCMVRGALGQYCPVTSPHIYLLDSLVKAVPKRPSVRWPESESLAVQYCTFWVCFLLKIWDYHTNQKGKSKVRWNDSIQSWKVFVLQAFFSHVPSINIRLSPMTLENSNNSFSRNGNIFVETHILFGNWLSVTTSSSSNTVIFQKWLEQNKWSHEWYYFAKYAILSNLWVLVPGAKIVPCL